MRSAAFRAAVLAALAIVAGAAQGKGKAHAAHVISARGAAFEPRVLEVSAGDTVEWKNDDVIPHNILARDRSFASRKDLDPGQTYRWVAKARGSHPYFCTLHPVMTGSVVVK